MLKNSKNLEKFLVRVQPLLFLGSYDDGNCAGCVYEVYALEAARLVYDKDQDLEGRGCGCSRVGLEAALATVLVYINPENAPILKNLMLATAADTGVFFIYHCLS